MQPPSSSTNSSALARRAASTPIAPISFSTTAIRRPCGARRRALIRVVLPLPRKPPTMVTGMRTGATRLRQQAGDAALREQVDGVRPADGAADLVRERLAALGEVRRADLEQPAIVCEAQRRLEQHPRHRLRAPDAALQEILLAERHAAAEEGALIERRVQLLEQEGVGDDQVGV